MPEKNPNGSINLTKKFFELTGPTGFDWMLSLGTGVRYIGAAYTDALEKMAKETQEAFPNAYKNIIGKDPKSLANDLAKGTGAFLEFSETIPILGQTQKLFYKLPKANEKIARSLKRKALKNKEKAKKAWNKTLNVSKMRGATAQQIQEKKDAAKKVA